MILSHGDLFKPSSKRRRIEASITTNHSGSSYGQSVIVLEDGGVLDSFSWVTMDYKVVQATDTELAVLERMGLL